MRSISRTIKFWLDLNEAIELRWRALGYKSFSAYIKGLIRYDLLVQGPHDASLPLSNAPEEKQAKVDAELLKITKKGVGVRGQLLKRLLEQVRDDGQMLFDGLLNQVEH